MYGVSQQEPQRLSHEEEAEDILFFILIRILILFLFLFSFMCWMSIDNEAHPCRVLRMHQRDVQELFGESVYNVW
jgi:cell division protein FtsB